jgi:hypothetical protein
MAKTKPIGVRFDIEIMEEIKGSAQNVLITLESFYKTSKIKRDYGEIKNLKTEDMFLFFDKNGVKTDKVAGKPVTVTLKPENYHHNTSNKTNTDIKNENEGESMPEVDNSLILKQIEFVKNEVKPAFIDKSKFERYQEKKIAELKAKLK